MIIDSKGKLFGKISIIDILIVLVLLAAIAGVGYKYAASKTTTPFTVKDDIRMKFYGAEVPEYAANSVKAGDTVKDLVKGTVFGTVKEVVVDKAISVASTDRGEIVQASRPGFASIMITVEGKGLLGDGRSGVTIDNSEYYIGDAIDKLRAGNAALYYNVRVYDISKKR